MVYVNVTYFSQYSLSDDHIFFFVEITGLCIKKKIAFTLEPELPSSLCISW